MNSFLNIAKKTIFVVAAFLAGISLFLIIGAYNLNITIFDSGFHKQLFEKHDIYSKTHIVISSSIKQYIDSFKKSSSVTFEQHKEIFLLLQNSITPEIVRINLDSTREGLFQYFKGERKFLPDIYLNKANEKNVQANSGTAASSSNKNQNSPLQALSKIEKVNLSAILQYINRSDISDSLFEIKFVNYIMNQTPSFNLLLLFLFALIGLYICGKFISVTKWLAIFALTSGVLTLISGIGSYFFVYSIMPKVIYPLAISLPLQSDVIVAYLRDCITPTAESLTLFGVFFITISAAVFYLPVLIPILFFKKQSMINDKTVPNRTNRIIKNTIFTFFCLLLLSAIFYTTNMIRADFEANDFSIAISKMRNANTVTEVISAKNEAIYTLNVRILDKKNSLPIANTKINVYGKSVVQDKYLNETISTDNSGIARFTLDKGAFRISFDSENFPEQYQMPAAFFYDLKSPGTTIITVSLEEPEIDEQQSWGIAEIEVLDKENKPVQGIELTVDGIVSAPGFPNDVFSITNSEGIAVFKITPGSYKFSFVSEKFPKLYSIPIPIDANIAADSVTRYTVRLVDTVNKKKND